MAWDGCERRGGIGGAEGNERLAVLENEVKHVRADLAELTAHHRETRTLMHDMRGDMQKLVAVASAGGTALGVMVKLGSMVLGAIAGVVAIGWWLWQHVRLAP